MQTSIRLDNNVIWMRRQFLTLELTTKNYKQRRRRRRTSTVLTWHETQEGSKERVLRTFVRVFLTISSPQDVGRQLLADSTRTTSVCARLLICFIACSQNCCVTSRIFTLYFYIYFIYLFYFIFIGGEKGLVACSLLLSGRCLYLHSKLFIYPGSSNLPLSLQRGGGCVCTCVTANARQPLTPIGKQNTRRFFFYKESGLENHRPATCVFYLPPLNSALGGLNAATRTTSLLLSTTSAPQAKWGEWQQTARLAAKLN